MIYKSATHARTLPTTGAIFCSLVILFALLSCSRAEVIDLSRQHDDSVRTFIDFDGDWRFFQGHVSREDLDSLSSGDWKPVNLPHDYSIYGQRREDAPSGEPGGFFPGGIGWYAKDFTLRGLQDNQRVLLMFDGVYRDSDLWVNGRHAGHQFYGYIGRVYDITEHISSTSKNSILVRSDTSVQPNDRWYAGSGIFRHVHILVTSDLHIPQWGTFVRATGISADSADMEVQTELQNSSDATRNAVLFTRLISPDGTPVASSEFELELAAGEHRTVSQNFTVQAPRLWSPSHPRLYTAEQQITIAGATIDRYHTTFGIRSAEFDADRGFLLNGEKLFLKGVNLHHDGGAVGAAVPEEVWRRRLDILKNMGVNAIRFSHNPAAPELLDMCDEMGFIVFDEMYDKWAIQPNDQVLSEENSFESTWKADLTRFIRRDRNHPAVVIWSVGNEVYEQREDPEEGVRILNELSSLVHRLDPGRPVTAALHPDGEGEVPSRMMPLMDVVSYNYQTARMAGWHEAFPELPFIISETMQYQEDFSWAFELSDIDYSKNSLNMMGDFIAGQFIWSGIDYLGESRGWPDRGMRSGLLYTNGFRKASSYFIESRYSDSPMLEIAVEDPGKLRELRRSRSMWNNWQGPWISSHWTFPGYLGAQREVFVFTNSDEAELFQDGQSLGTRRVADSLDGVLRWTVRYTPGVLEAVGRSAGRVVAEDSLRTAGEAVGFRFLSDESSLTADPRDIIQIEVRAVDGQGTRVPGFDVPVEFSVDGPGRIIGIDNGDQGDTSGFLDSTQHLLEGRTLVIIQALGKTGRLTLHAVAENGFEGSLALPVQAP